MRSDIIEVSSRLEKGGLGLMEDTVLFEEKVRELGRVSGACVVSPVTDKGSQSHSECCHCSKAVSIYWSPEMYCELVLLMFVIFMKK